MTYSILLLTSPDKLKLADIRFPTTGEEKQHSDFWQNISLEEMLGGDSERAPGRNKGRPSGHFKKAAQQ